MRYIPYILLAQAGKNMSKEYTADIHMSDILNNAFAVVKAINDFIPCNVVSLDCKDHHKIIDLYKQAGFSILYNNPESNYPIQMYKVIK